MDVGASGGVRADRGLWQRDAPWIPGLRGDRRHQLRAGVSAEKIPGQPGQYTAGGIESSFGFRFSFLQLYYYGLGQRLPSLVQVDDS